MKKPIILIIAAGVLVIAGLFWVVTSQKSETITIDETKEPVVGESQEETFTGALKDIIARGVPMKCSYEIDGVGYEGLVKGKNYRGRVSRDGQVTEIIAADGYVYLWQEGKTQGMKMAFDIEAADEEDDENTATFTGSDIEYRCLPAVVGDDQFFPPQDVIFIDLDQMLDQEELSEDQIRQLGQMSEEEQGQ